MKFEFDELMTDGQVQEMATRLVERNEDFAIKIARAIEVADMDRFYVQREKQNENQSIRHFADAG
jgi:hypothetical protein